MVDPLLVKEWLDKAEEDFQFAVSVIEDRLFTPKFAFTFTRRQRNF